MPLLDSADDAFRRVLDLAEEHSQSQNGSLRDSEWTPVQNDGRTPASFVHAGQPTPSGGLASPLGDARQRGEDTARILERTGVLKGGTELVLLAPGLDRSDPRWRAVWDGSQGVRWEADQRHYALSKLTRRLRDAHNAPLPRGQLNGYLFWGLANDPTGRSLWNTAGRGSGRG